MRLNVMNKNIGILSLGEFVSEVINYFQASKHSYIKLQSSFPSLKNDFL